MNSAKVNAARKAVNNAFQNPSPQAMNKAHQMLNELKGTPSAEKAANEAAGSKAEHSAAKEAAAQAKNNGASPKEVKVAAKAAAAAVATGASKNEAVKSANKAVNAVQHGVSPQEAVTAAANGQVPAAIRNNHVAAVANGKPASIPAKALEKLGEVVQNTKKAAESAIKGTNAAMANAHQATAVAAVAPTNKNAQAAAAAQAAANAQAANAARLAAQHEAGMKAYANAQKAIKNLRNKSKVNKPTLNNVTAMAAQSKNVTDKINAARVAFGGNQTIVGAILNKIA